MNSKNTSDYIFNIWIATAIIPPIMSYILSFFSDNYYNFSSKNIFILAFVIFFSMMVSLPLYFIFHKISTPIFKIKKQNWVIKIILSLLAIVLILSAHLFLYHKDIYTTSSFFYGGKTILGFFLTLINFAKFYLFAGVLSIWFFKLERDNYEPVFKSQPDILDDDFNFEKKDIEPFH